MFLPVSLQVRKDRECRLADVGSPLGGEPGIKLFQVTVFDADAIAGKATTDLFVPVSHDDQVGLQSDGAHMSSPAQEIRLRTHGGRDRTAPHCAAPIRMQGTEAVQGCVVDITDWKELEQHLLQHQKMESLGTLVSGIAHEFNNILAAMMPQTELLTRRARETPAVERPAQIILSMAEKASRLTRQLLNMSRKPTMEKMSLDVNAWMNWPPRPAASPRCRVFI